MRWRNSNIDGEHIRGGPQYGKLAIVCSVIKLRLGVEVWIGRPVGSHVTSLWYRCSSINYCTRGGGSNLSASGRQETLLEYNPVAVFLLLDTQEASTDNTDALRGCMSK